MADASPGGINFLALAAPDFAAQQLRLQQQQALAQQLMQQGGEPSPNNELANPGGLVIPQSPWAAAGKALEKGYGGYLSGKTTADQLEAYKQLSTGMNPQAGALGNGLSTPQIASPTDALHDPQFLSDALTVGPDNAYKGYLARYETSVAGTKKAAETANTPYVTPQGTYSMGSQIMGNRPQSSPAPISRGTPKIAPTPGPISEDEQAAVMDKLESRPSNVMPNKMPNTPSEQSMAGDGKPLLPNLTNIPAPDPSGTPKFKTENTKTGVEQTIQDQKDAAEGNKAFAATAQSLGQEASRLDNLIQVYKDVQSGTLTAQNPEFFNKMAALGFRDDPKSIKDLAGIQNATQNHILQVIQQIKDTNANAGGGAPTRTFGSEISQLLENGESAKGQPEALWNVIGQAKGVVDHHLDMVNGWQKSGGLGNRLAGGYTMRPDDFASQFSTSHNITDYRDKALKDMGPFKGMAGNAGVAATADGRIPVITPDGKKGTIDPGHLQDLLKAGGRKL